MSPVEIFGVQLILSMTVVGMLAAWSIWPRLTTLPMHVALFWLTVPHAFRHIGLVFKVPGVVAPEIPTEFSAMAAYGDLAAGLIALVALVALHYRRPVAVPLVWLLTLVGSVDLGNALSRAEAIPYLQSAWFIPTFLVPVLLVSHLLTAMRLTAPYWRRQQAAAE